jgi:tetratricopeptide (TPR) repeat protein
LDVNASTVKGRRDLPRLPVLMVVAPVLIFQMVAQLALLRAAYKWKTLTIATPTSKHVILRAYNEILPFFSNNGEFLYEYGKMLMMLGEPNLAQQYLLRATSRFTSVDLYVSLGEIFESNREYKSASFYYTKAADMVPHRFTARYSLWKLYKNTGQDSDRKRVEYQILNQEIKVSSPEVREMLDEVKTNSFNDKIK